MRQYLDLLEHIIENGVNRSDRTGVGTRGVFGYQYRHDLCDGFPLLTTKKLPIKAIVHDMLWMLRGDTNIKYLNDHGVHIWDPWADSAGDVGPVYGSQWRSWQGPDGSSIDQISAVLEEIKSNPNSRRLVVSAWNVADLDRMAIPPCPTLFQFYVADGKLSCHLYQRSADAFLGLPFNIAGFALLTTMFAHVTGLQPGEFIHSFGDVHLYEPHIPLAKEQLLREPFPLPNLKINQKVNELLRIQYQHVSVEKYRAHPHIKAEVAI